MYALFYFNNKYMKDIAISKDKIITIIKDINDTYEGFDLITEKYSSIKKNECILNPSWLIPILGNMDLKMLITNNISDNCKERSKILNINLRTYYRYNAKLNDIEK